MFCAMNSSTVRGGRNLSMIQTHCERSTFLLNLVRGTAWARTIISSRTQYARVNLITRALYVYTCFSKYNTFIGRFLSYG